MTNKGPDIVLLDIKMRHMDGIAVLKNIKDIAPKTVVVMVTAVDDMTKMKEAQLLGARDYVTKPLVLEDLERKVVNIALEVENK